MVFKYLPSVVSLTLFLLTLSEYSVAQMLYEGDFCDFAGYEGTCLPTSKCFHLESIMQELGLKSYNVGRCGFTITEELICCPKWPTPLQMPPVQLPPELPNEYIDFSKGFPFPTPQTAETTPNPWQNGSLDDKINAIFSGATSNNNGISNSADLWNVNVNENSNGLLNESTPVVSGNTVEILNNSNTEQPKQVENLDDILRKLFNTEPDGNENRNQGLRPENTVLDENINEKIQNIFSGKTISVGNQNQNASSERPITDEEVNERIKNIFDLNPTPVESDRDQPIDTINADQTPSGSLNEMPKNIFNSNHVQDEKLLNAQQDLVGVNRTTVGNLNQNSLTGNTLRDEITNENIENAFKEPRKEFIESSNKERIPDEKLDESINKSRDESLKPDGDLSEKWINIFNGNSTADENHITNSLTKFTDGKRQESIINTNQLNLNLNPAWFDDKEKLKEEIQNPTAKDFDPEISLESSPWLDNNQMNGSSASDVMGMDIAEVNPSQLLIESTNFMPSGDTKVRDNVAIETTKDVFEENSDGNGNENSKTINFGNEDVAAVGSGSSNGAFIGIPVAIGDQKVGENGGFQEKTPAKYDPSNIPYPVVPVGDIKVGLDNMYLDNEFQGTPFKYEPPPPEIPPPVEYPPSNDNQIHNHNFKENPIQNGFSKDQIESKFNKDSSQSDRQSESSEAISFPDEYGANAEPFEQHNNNDYFNKNQLPPIHQFNQPQLPHGNIGSFYGPPPPPPPNGHAFNGNSQNVRFENQQNGNQFGFNDNARHRDSMIHDIIRDSAFDLANRFVETRQKVVDNLKTVNPFRNYVIQTRSERRRNRNRNRFPWH